MNASCPTRLSSLPGHSHKKLLVTVPSHAQTKCCPQLHKSPTQTHIDVIRRYGWEGDFLVPNLGERGDRETDVGGQGQGGLENSDITSKAKRHQCSTSSL